MKFLGDREGLEPSALRCHRMFYHYNYPPPIIKLGGPGRGRTFTSQLAKLAYYRCYDRPVGEKGDNKLELLTTILNFSPVAVVAAY